MILVWTLSTKPGTLGCAMLRKYKLLLLRTDGGYNLIITCFHLQVPSKLLFTSHDTLACMSNFPGFTKQLSFPCKYEEQEGIFFADYIFLPEDWVIIIFTSPKF